MSERKPFQSELDRAIMDLPGSPVGLQYVASVLCGKRCPWHKPHCEEVREPRPTEVSIDPDLQKLQETTNTQIKLLKIA